MTVHTKVSSQGALMDGTDLAFAGAAEQARWLASGAVSAPELTELYLERISRLDPELNAFRLVRAEAARAEATEAQRRLDAGERLPLLGVPIVVKDDVDVAGEVTTWGTSAHGDAAERDAEVVAWRPTPAAWLASAAASRTGASPSCAPRPTGSRSG